MLKEDQLKIYRSGETTTYFLLNLIEVGGRIMFDFLNNLRLILSPYIAGGKKLQFPINSLYLCRRKIFIIYFCILLMQLVHIYASCIQLIGA